MVVLWRFYDGFPAEKAPLSPHEWGFSNKMLDLTRHIDKVRKA